MKNTIRTDGIITAPKCNCGSTQYTRQWLFVENELLIWAIPQLKCNTCQRIVNVGRIRRTDHIPEQGGTNIANGV
jgi:hypothetical protein